MFGLFSESAIGVIVRAQYEASIVGHKFAGTEYLLLGIIQDNAGESAQLLRQKNVNILSEARAEVEKLNGRKPICIHVQVPLARESSRVLQLAIDESRLLGHPCFMSDHLLLGLLKIPDCSGCLILRNLGFDLTELRNEVLAKIPSVEQSIDRPSATGLPIMQTCPNCAERIKAKAHACYYCGYGIADDQFFTCDYCKERIRRGSTKCRFCYTLFNSSAS